MTKLFKTMTALVALLVYAGALASDVKDFNDTITFATGDRIFPCSIINNDENGNMRVRIKSKLIDSKAAYDTFEVNQVMLFKNKNYLVVHVQKCNQPHCMDLQLNLINKSEHTGVLYWYAYHISATQADGTLFVTVKTPLRQACVVVPDYIIEINGKKYEMEDVQKTGERGCFSLKAVPCTRYIAEKKNFVDATTVDPKTSDRPNNVINIVGTHNYQIESMGKNNKLYAFVVIDAFSNQLEEYDIIGTIDGVTYLIWSIEFSEIPGYLRVELSDESMPCKTYKTKQSCDLVGITGRFNYCIKTILDEELDAVIAKDTFNGEPKVGDLIGYRDGKKHHILSVAPSEIPDYINVKLSLR